MKQSIMTSYIVAVQSFGELNCIFSDFHWKWLWACRSVTSSLNTQLAGQGVRCFSHNCISLISASKVIVLIPILTARDDSELNSSAVSLWKCYVLTSSASVTKCPTVTVESLGLPSFDLKRATLDTQQVMGVFQASHGRLPLKMTWSLLLWQR